MQKVRREEGDGYSILSLDDQLRIIKRAKYDTSENFLWGVFFDYEDETKKLPYQERHYNSNGFDSKNILLRDIFGRVIQEETFQLEGEQMEPSDDDWHKVAELYHEYDGIERIKTIKKDLKTNIEKEVQVSQNDRFAKLEKEFTVVQLNEFEEAQARMTKEESIRRRNGALIRLRNISAKRIRTRRDRQQPNQLDFSEEPNDYRTNSSEIA